MKHKPTKIKRSTTYELKGFIEFLMLILVIIGFVGLIGSMNLTSCEIGNAVNSLIKDNTLFLECETPAKMGYNDYIRDNHIVHERIVLQDKTTHIETKKIGWRYKHDIWVIFGWMLIMFLLIGIHKIIDNKNNGSPRTG